MSQATDTFNSRIFHELDFDKPGKQLGYLRLPQSRDGGAWSVIEIPIGVVNGGKGPAVLFTGGVHGDEYEGQIAISRLARHLDPASVNGKIIMLPAVDLPAALAGRRMCPIDGRDFNRCMPGDARGSFCQMLAHFIESTIMPQVEVSVDVHSAGNSMEAALCSIMHWVDDPKVTERTLALAETISPRPSMSCSGVWTKPLPSPPRPSATVPCQFLPRSAATVVSGPTLYASPSAGWITCSNGWISLMANQMSRNRMADAHGR
jgi:N-alpha-acetyl-L-2,4-diaminobutyrate deacetylase